MTDLGAFQLIPQEVAGAVLLTAFVIVTVFWPYIYR